MASLGLLADYGSSDSDSECGNSTQTSVNDDVSVFRKDEPEKYPSINFLENNLEDEEKNEEISESEVKVEKKKKKKALSNPLRTCSVSRSVIKSTKSVFYNPFLKEQEVKKSILEKHVKLSTNPKDIREINGKKICWNYRKGRCKFGHNCKYAHDSDIAGSLTTENESVSTPSVGQLCGVNGENNVKPQDLNQRKRKPGLPRGLVPSKRSRGNFKKMQMKESPWRANTR